MAKKCCDNCKNNKLNWCTMLNEKIEYGDSTRCQYFDERRDNSFVNSILKTIGDINKKK